MTLSAFPHDTVTDEAVEETAIQWLVELRSGVSDPVSRRKFEHWLGADIRHQRAWRKLGQAVDATFGGMGGMAGLNGNTAASIGQTLNRAALQNTKRRRLLGGALMFAGAAVGAGWMMRGSPFIDDWPADLHTGTAKRERFTLADGSVLTLNARSSVDIDFNDQRRLVRLRQGELVAEVTDPTRLPFIIQSRHGDVQALGTRLMVGVAAQATRTLAMRAGLGIQPRQADTPTLLPQGQAAQFDELRVTLLAQSVPDEAAAWMQGKLLAFDLPLGDVTDALRPYLNGLIHISVQAAALRVTGNYSLDDPAQTLLALAETLPIHVTRSAGGLLTRITARQA